MSGQSPGGTLLTVDRPGREIVDPAEPWEVPIPSSAVSRIDPSGEGARMSRPTSDDELPPGVLRILRFTCGSLPLERTLLLAPSARPIDRTCRRYVATPVQVLAFGERATGLWVDWRRRDPAVVIPVERIGSVEDIRILRYRRLSVRAADARLSIRYRAEGRELLDPPLWWLRKKIGRGVRGEVPAAGLRVVGDVEVPTWWQAAARGVVADAGEEGAAMVFGAVAAARSAHPARAVLIAVTSSELLVMADPEGGACDPAASPAMLAVPRHALQEVTADGDRLVIRSAGVDRVLSIGAGLATAAAELASCAGPARAPLQIGH